MKGVWAVPVIFSILFIGSLGLSQDVFAALCGDGVVEGFEECDNGPANNDSIPDACRSDCTNPSCGDFVIDFGEECDDGNLVDDNGNIQLSAANHDLIPDRCRTDCSFPSCGDGTIDAGEQCDDGNTDKFDGCFNCLLTACGDAGALVTCESDLADTEADLTTCESDLADTEADLTTCNSDLMSCEGDLADTEAELVTTQADLTTALDQIAEFLETLQSGEIEVCHNGKTKVVTLGGLGGHLAHGDTLGAC